MPSHGTIGQHLSIWTLFLCLGVITRAQDSGINDLPACAKTCATAAATSSGCNLTDTSCICNHPAFSTDTFDCVDNSCNFGEQSTAYGIFQGLCASATLSSSTSTSTRPPAPAGTTTVAVSSSSSSTQAPTPSSSSSGGGTPSNPSQPAQANPTTLSTTSTTSSASASASTSTTTPAVVVGTITPVAVPTSSSASSTVVVVQTVVLPSSSSSAAGKADVPFSQAGAVIFTLIFGWVVAKAVLVGV